MNKINTNSDITSKPIQKNEKLLCIIFFVGLLFFVITLFFRNNLSKQHQQYLENQTQVATCDINYVLDYQFPYMGNSSNTTGLFSLLPLSNQIKDFQLYPDTLTVQVNFLDTYLSAGRGNDLSRDLIYDATTAFALIDNLEQVEYSFSDGTYLVKRSEIENVFGSLSIPIQEDTWKKVIQEPLCDDAFLDSHKELLSLLLD